MPLNRDAALSQLIPPAVDVPLLLMAFVAVVFWFPPELTCCCPNATGLIDATSPDVHNSSASPTDEKKKTLFRFIKAAGQTLLLGVPSSSYE